MARPRRGEELGATSTIGVRVSDDMRATIEEEAARNGHSLTDEVRALLAEGIAGRKKSRKKRD